MRLTYGLCTTHIRRTYGVHTTYIRRTYDVPTTYIRRTYDVPTTYLRRTYNVLGKAFWLVGVVVVVTVYGLRLRSHKHREIGGPLSTPDTWHVTQPTDWDLTSLAHPPHHPTPIFRGPNTGLSPRLALYTGRLYLFLEARLNTYPGSCYPIFCFRRALCCY
jgi:hypothetical protein